MGENTDQPDWANVLLTLYDQERSRFRHDSSESDYSIPDSHLLVGEGGTGLDRDDVDDALVFLRDAGLLEIDFPDDEWVLTEKGFSVANERIMMEEQEERENARVKRQNKVNRFIGVLTLVLLFINAVNIVILTFLNLDLLILGIPNEITTLGILAIGVSVVASLVWKISESDIGEELFSSKS